MAAEKHPFPMSSIAPFLRAAGSSGSVSGGLFSEMNSSESIRRDGRGTVATPAVFAKSNVFRD
ncbi:MAG TPA: hypothetical protein VHX68_17660, partial [Planctomycetaceae bacterium]|nr:hypothetical protein [Planctomycetaceae bacterium]